MRFGLILVGLMAIVAFQLRSDTLPVYATGAAADLMCIKANPECGKCGMLKNPQTGKCEFKGILANPYMCPKYCYDITSGQVAAKGECIAPGKCKASECGGKQCEQPKMPEMPKPPPPMPPMPPPPPPPSTPKDCPPKDGKNATSTSRSSDGSSKESETFRDANGSSEDNNWEADEESKDKNKSKEDCPEDTDTTSASSSPDSGFWITEESSPTTVDAFRSVLDDIARQGVGGCGGSLSLVCPVVRALSTIRNATAATSSPLGFVGHGIGSGFTVMALFGGNEFGVYDSRYGLLTTQDLTDLQAASTDMCDTACLTRLEALEERYRNYKPPKSAENKKGGQTKVFIEPGGVTGFAPPPGTYVSDTSGFTQNFVTKIWRSVLNFLGL